MDRLVCGDVGFGKTEVALRAAFCAAINGKQEIVVGAIRDDKGTLIRLDFQGIVRPDASAEPVSAASGDAGKQEPSK